MWNYSEYIGAAGGWDAPGPDGTVYIVAREMPSGRWAGYVIRELDSATLFSRFYASKDEAMRNVAADAELV